MKALKRLSIAAVVLLTLFIFLSGFVYFNFPGITLKAIAHGQRWAAEVRKHELKVDDQTWVYLEGGAGEPIVFLHGFGLHKDYWGNMLKKYSPTNRIIAVDLPGFGQSSKNISLNYDTPNQTARLNQFLEKKGIDSFHLVGFSMGGGIAAYYSGTYPDKVKSLLLLGPGGFSAEKESEFIRETFKTRENMLTYKTVEEYDVIVGYAYHTPPPIPMHFKKYIVKEFGAKNNELHDKIARDLFGDGKTFLDPILPKITAPTLVIWGREDRILDVSCTKTIKAGIKNCKSLILDNTGHTVHIEQPEKVIAAYSEFLSSLD